MNTAHPTNTHRLFALLFVRFAGDLDDRRHQTLFPLRLLCLSPSFKRLNWPRQGVSSLQTSDRGEQYASSREIVGAHVTSFAARFTTQRCSPTSLFLPYRWIFSCAKSKLHAFYHLRNIKAKMVSVRIARSEKIA